MSATYDGEGIDQDIMARLCALQVAVTLLLDAAQLAPGALQHFDAISEQMRSLVLNRSLPDSFYDVFDQALVDLRSRLKLRDKP